MAETEAQKARRLRAIQGEEPPMTAGAETTKPGRFARLRERRQERRQVRAWRRERRKGYVNAYDAHNQAESSNFTKGGFFKKD